jgi:hypothetical protein
MSNRFLVVLATLVALAAAAIAQAASTKPSKHTISDPVQLRSLTASSQLIVYTGTVKDKTFGAGVAETRATPGSAGVLNYTGTAFFKAGTISAKGTIKPTSNPDGSTTYTGTFKVTGGTGALKGATGKGTLVASATSADPTLSTGTLKGTFTY